MPGRPRGGPGCWAGRPSSSACSGVRRFHDPRLRRRGAFPPPIKLVRFGGRALHGLDDAAHHARKALLLDVLAPDAVDELGRTADAVWRQTVTAWPPGHPVVLLPS